MIVVHVSAFLAVIILDFCHLEAVVLISMLLTAFHPVIALAL